MSINKSITERWFDAGLDGSIAVLAPGDPEGPDHMLKPGSSSMKSDGGPSHQLLPRARYCVLPAELMEMTAGSKVYAQKFFVFLYAKQLSTLNDYAELVITAFENSHIATTDPFSLEEGCVIHLDWTDRQDNVRYADVKFVELLFEVVYVRPRQFPS